MDTEMNRTDRCSIPSLFNVTIPLRPYSTWLYIFVRLVLLINIVLALLPLMRGKDDLSDIPLTPAQRRLLGLAPSSTPPAPGSTYVTPPRYARSATGSPSSRSLHSGSPLSGKGNAFNESGYSQNASPLLQKAMGGSMSGRRDSYGSSLGNGRSNSFDMPGTPTPSTHKGATVGLNSRWLYEKGRTSSGSSRPYS